MSRFAAQILRVDVQTKALYVQELFNIPVRVKKVIGAFRSAPSAEFQGGACSGGYWGWGAILAKFGHI